MDSVCGILNLNANLATATGHPLVVIEPLYDDVDVDVFFVYLYFLWY